MGPQCKRVPVVGGGPNHHVPKGQKHSQYSTSKEIKNINSKCAHFQQTMFDEYWVETWHYMSPEETGPQISFPKIVSNSKRFPGIRTTSGQTDIKQNQDQVQESTYHPKPQRHCISSLHKTEDSNLLDIK